MVYDQIHDHSDSPLMAAIAECDEIIERTVHRIDRLVIRDIIAIVIARRLIDRGKPDSIHAERCYVIKAADDTFEITNAITIGIREASWIYLIDHKILEPVLASLHRTSSMLAFTGPPMISLQ